MSDTLVLDLSRLWLASLRPTPRGIERVDCAFASLLCAAWPGPLTGLMWTPWGVRVFDRNRVKRLIDHVTAVWREDAPADQDEVYRRIRQWLSGTAVFEPAPILSQPRHLARRGRAAVRTIGATGFAAGRRALHAIPEGAIYLNLGHVGFAVPGLAPFLKARSDLRMVALVHDVISLTDPQFFGQRNERYFAQVLASVTGHADLVLATSDDAAKTIGDLLATRGLVRRIGVVDLSPVFADIRPPHPDAGLGDQPYFVICGTREPRKNHVMLLTLWRRMVDEGRTVPKLIVAGGRGWGSGALDAMLERSDALRGHVIRVEDLGSPGLFQLMAQASAVLVPSLAEGFGLPVVEALRLGAPVIASDIPVFAETSGGAATLIDPLDGPGWQRAIHDHAARRETMEERRRRAEAFARRTPRHSGLRDWLGTLAA